MPELLFIMGGAMKRSSIMTVQRLMRLKTNTLVSTRILSSSYPARHAHPQSRDGSFGGSHAMNSSRTTIPISSVKLASSCPTRLLSSSSTPLIKMMTDAIEMQRSKTQKLLDCRVFLVKRLGCSRVAALLVGKCSRDSGGSRLVLEDSRSTGCRVLKEQHD